MATSTMKQDEDDETLDLSQSSQTTQPFDEVANFEILKLREDPEDQTNVDNWGFLHPHPRSKITRSYGLEHSTYVFGKSDTCDYIFTEEDLGERAIYFAASQEQFEINREFLTGNEEIVTLKDLSFNGTFVNKTKVGKNKKVVLATNDQISIVFPTNIVLIFVDVSSTRNWLSEEMKTRFKLKVYLGKGSFGEVRLAFDTLARKDVAIKKIHKGQSMSNASENEIKILQKLSCPFIVLMEDSFHTDNHAFIVLEYVSGGTLNDKVDNRILEEQETKLIVHQLASALHYLHREGIVHRDVKPENVLLTQYPMGDLAKLSDFGLSKICSPGLQEELRTNCGTPSFRAPEIIKTMGTGSYTHQVDVWSLGVLVYFCLSGDLPFKERMGLSVDQAIVRGSYQLVGPIWRKSSPRAISLIRRLLVVDVQQRATLQEIFQHPWFKDQKMIETMNKLMECISRGVENVAPRTCNFPPNKRPRRDSSSDGSSTSTVRRS